MSWKLIRLYWFATLATVVVWGLVGWRLGLSALLTVIVLTLLETTFSADNAVINSKILASMSPFWQRLFVTMGIFTAVFVVRFIVPIAIVMAGSGLHFGTVLDLALHHPAAYEQDLHRIEPVINAFGGTFLLMIALSYFIDYEKRTHWLGWLERYLGKLGRFDNVTVFFMLLASLAVYLTVGRMHREVVLIASIGAMTLHIGLQLMSATMRSRQTHIGSAAGQVGLSALAAFLYLEVLDASFSLDGVVGAFALTNDVVLIMAGLGGGAVWVRAMTLHLVRSNVLGKYVFLEHGAHWAIAFLGSVMMFKLYGVNLPEWVVGTLGLACIGASIWWSGRRPARSTTELLP